MDLQPKPTCSINLTKAELMLVNYELFRDSSDHPIEHETICNKLITRGSLKNYFIPSFSFGFFGAGRFFLNGLSRIVGWKTIE